MNNEQTVNSTTEVYERMMERWTLPDSLMAGEIRMKALASESRLYLPQEPMESDAAYINRLERTTLENWLESTVINHTGRVFNKPMKISEDTPDLIKKYNENLNLAGNGFNSFYRPVFKDSLVRGISYVYVDFPRMMDDISFAEEQEMKLRPYAIHVKAPQVIEAKSANINGRTVLVRARIRELLTVDDGVWGTKEVEQVRVLYPGRWEVYRATDDNKGWYLFDEGESSLSYIPLFPLYCEEIDFFEGKSYLQNMANNNRALWQSMSDQMNIVHVARVPILYGVGFNEDESFEVGANRAIMGPDNSDLKFVEHTGKAIGAGRDEINDLRERLAYESLSAVSDNDYSAAGKALDVSDNNAQLQDFALRLQELATKVNNCMCDYEGLNKVGSVIVDTDFGLHLRDGSIANILLKMRQNGSLSLEAFQKEMKRYSVLSIDHDIEADITLLEEEKEKQLDQQNYQNEFGKQVVGDGEAEDLDTGKPRVEG